MNIFKILANGNGNIYEPSVSAFLGYLLNTNEDHGLNDMFLKKFLNKVFGDAITLQGIDDIVVELEFKINTETTSSKNNIRYIDIKISLQLTDGKKINLYIENKISKSAKNKGQIEDITNAIREFNFIKTVNDDINNYFIYLTPKNVYDIEFKKAKQLGNNARHIFWESQIIEILEETINNINDLQTDNVSNYIVKTIISFIDFIKTGFKSKEQEIKLMKKLGYHEALDHINKNFKKFVKSYNDLFVFLNQTLPNDFELIHVVNEGKKDSKVKKHNKISILGKVKVKPIRIFRFEFLNKHVEILIDIPDDTLKDDLTNRNIKFTCEKKYPKLIRVKTKFDSQTIEQDKELVLHCLQKLLLFHKI